MQYFMDRWSQTEVRIATVLVSGITESDPDLSAFSDMCEVSIVGETRAGRALHMEGSPSTNECPLCDTVVPLEFVQCVGKLSVKALVQ